MGGLIVTFLGVQAGGLKSTCRWAIIVFASCSNGVDVVFGIGMRIKNMSLKKQRRASGDARLCGGIIGC